MAKANRINPFEQKRLASFDSLGTNKTQWRHAQVIDFKYSEYTSKSRKTGEEKTMERWIPVYRIPEGYTNPYSTDPLVSETKKCQLCDTDIVRYGILLHDEKKIYLVVGLECYEVYESDDDRKIKYELLAQLQDELMMKRLTEERAKMVSMVEKHRDAVSYTFYATIAHGRWNNWSKTKFFNFIIKSAGDTAMIGYKIPEWAGAKVVLKFARQTMIFRVNHALHMILKERKEKFGYRVELIKRGSGTDMYTMTKMMKEQVGKMNLDELRTEWVNKKIYPKADDYQAVDYYDHSKVYD